MKLAAIHEPLLLLPFFYYFLFSKIPSTFVAFRVVYSIAPLKNTWTGSLYSLAGPFQSPAEEFSFTTTKLEEEEEVFGMLHYTKRHDLFKHTLCIYECGSAQRYRGVQPIIYSGHAAIH